MPEGHDPTSHERSRIRALHQRGLSFRGIGRQPERAASTILREFGRNGGADGSHDVVEAQRLTGSRRHRAPSVPWKLKEAGPGRAGHEVRAFPRSRIEEAPGGDTDDPPHAGTVRGFAAAYGYVGQRRRIRAAPMDFILERLAAPPCFACPCRLWARGPGGHPNGLPREYFRSGRISGGWPRRPCGGRGTRQQPAPQGAGVPDAGEKDGGGTVGSERPTSRGCWRIPR